MFNSMSPAFILKNHHKKCFTNGHQLSHRKITTKIDSLIVTCAFTQINHEEKDSLKVASTESENSSPKVIH